MQFRDDDIKAFWEGGPVPKRVPSDCRAALARKLQILDAAAALSDLRVPPGNRLEKLKGSREGQHSVRVNDQWRLCFAWKDGEATEVEFCDCH